MTFLARLFSFFRRLAAPQTPPPADPVPRVQTVSRPVQNLFIGWNEMIDADARIAGYLLRVRSPAGETEIDGQRLFDTLAGERVLKFAERRPVVVPLTLRQWQTADFRQLIAPWTFFLLIDEGLAPTEKIAVLDQIKAAGGRLAIEAGFSGEIGAIEARADLLILSFRATTLAIFEAKARAIRQHFPQVIVVADEVDSWSEHRLCQSLGINYSIGQFAASLDDADNAERLSQSRLVVIQLLNLLRSDAESDEIVATAKRDPAIVLKLLQMANSPVHGLSRSVASLDEAIVVLGRDVLYRWLAVAMFRIDAVGGRDQTLLVIALCRAAFLESMVRQRDKKVADELFLVGLLSVIESLLGMPMVRVLEKMSLPDSVVAVLLNNEGPYAKYLLLVMAMERCRLDQAVLIATELQIEIPDLIRCYGEAMSWATAELLEK